MTTRLTTTGTELNVIIADLGSILFQHPIVDFDLELPEGVFSLEQIKESLEEGDLGSRVTAGEIVITDSSGNTLSPGNSELDAVRKTGNETIAGIKTFSERVEVSSLTYSVDIQGNNNALTNVEYVDNAVGALDTDLATLRVRNTAGLNPIPTTWTDFTWNTTDEQNDTSILEYTGTPADEIEIKEAGLYLLSWAISADDECDVRITNNGAVVAGSFHGTGDKTDSNQNLHGNEKTMAVTLAVGILVLQVQATTTAEFIIPDDAVFSVTRLKGSKGTKGDKGDTGTGSSIEIQNEGTPVPNGPFTAINFTGDINATDAGSNIANVDLVLPVPYGSIRVQTIGADTSINYNVTTGAIPVTFSGTPTTLGSGSTYFSNSNGTITCNFDGAIEVEYDLPHFSLGNRAHLKSLIQLNNVDFSAPAYSYIRDGNFHRRDTNSGSDTIAVNNGDTIRIAAERGEESTISDDITLIDSANIRIKRVI